MMTTFVRTLEMSYNSDSSDGNIITAVMKNNTNNINPTDRKPGQETASMRKRGVFEQGLVLVWPRL